MNIPMFYWWGFRCIKWGINVNYQRVVIDLGPIMIMAPFNNAAWRTK